MITKEDRLYKLFQGSDTAVWAHDEIVNQDKRITELEKELDSALYFNIDVIRCLSKIAWEHNHDEIPAYMNLAKECIEKIELKQVKALKEQGE